MSTCCVNKSGKVVPVYNASRAKIGELTQNEFFSKIGSEGSQVAIYFLGPNGKALEGLLISPPKSTVTSIEQYPYGTAKIDGTTYKTYYMRETKNLYDINGSVIGSVAAGKRVACLTGLGGNSKPYLKAINYAAKRAGGWENMSNNGYSYGFVDTGLRTSSSKSGIALYGSW